MRGGAGRSSSPSLGGLGSFHPDPEGASVYLALQEDVGRWLFVHVAQLVLAPFVAFTLWAMLSGIDSWAASV